MKWTKIETLDPHPRRRIIVGMAGDVDLGWSDRIAARLRWSHYLELPPLPRTAALRPYQVPPEATGLPDALRHVVVFDFRVRDADVGLLEEGEFRPRGLRQVARRSQTVDRICLHSWLTRGDVGDKDGAPERRLHAAATAILPDLAGYPIEVDNVTSEALRTLTTPYHRQAGVAKGLGGKREPFVVLAHHDDLYLYHGHLYNPGVAVSAMWGAKDEPDSTEDALRRDAFAAAVFLAGLDHPLCPVVGHKQAKWNRSDPGRRTLGYAGYGARLLRLHTDITLRLLDRETRGSGNPLSDAECRAWRENAEI